MIPKIKVLPLIFALTGLLPLCPQAQPVLEVWQIQGTGTGSPYVNQTVTTPQNIVTAVASDRFFIQTPAERSDLDPATSDGMAVLTDAPASLSPGDVVSITGRIVENESMTSFSTNDLVLSPVTEVLPLPSPVTLTAAFPATAPAPPVDLERVEGMRIQFEATVGGPSDFEELVALYTAPDRPFREAGIHYPGLPGLPVWDGNPEVFWFDPNGLNAPNNRFINAGMTVAATAVLEQRADRYLALPLHYTATGGPLLQGVRDRQPNEITIGSINLLRLFEDNDNYSKKLRKMARYIVELMDTPDILAVQETGDLSDLQDLIFFIQLLNSEADYTPYYIPGFGSVNTAYLIRPTIQNAAVSQLGRLEFFSQGGHLHDRPPLLLEATVTTDPPTPVRVLNLHLRSLIGIEGGNSGFVRNKRFEQSVSVANMVEQLQEEDLVVLGDFNAFPFTDGYVDVFNQISGEPSLGAQFPVVDIVQPALIDHSESLPAQERYSYVFDGNAQLIDHCLSTDLFGFTVSGFAFARGNADNALAYESNEFVPTRASDHDGFVLFLTPNNTLADTEEAAGPANAPLRFPNPFRAGEDQLTLAGGSLPGEAFLRLFDTRGRLLWSRQTSGGPAVFSLPAELSSGAYLLQLTAGHAHWSEKIIIR